MTRRRREGLTFDDVRTVALAMEDVVEGTSYGTPAFRRRDKLFLRLREDGESLVVRTKTEWRDELLAAEPGTYYVTDHYVHYPWVLVRFAKMHPDALRDLLKTAWRLASSKRR